MFKSVAAANLVARTTGTAVNGVEIGRDRMIVFAKRADDNMKAVDPLCVKSSGMQAVERIFRFQIIHNENLAPLLLLMRRLKRRAASNVKDLEIFIEFGIKV